ncbi:hypothetical protein FKW77_008764 [Venturia effusa]|uniref:AAA+ ATPase domain-containing protein n=1 Tax=Venturia effusa TaxID=50376 RepID=A0A517LCV0_9PEZI|nr:hypothetical protein FKW77_008764 [Venturia effusa]
MRRTLCRRAAQQKATHSSPPLIAISNATFYRQHPSSVPKTSPMDTDGSTGVTDTNPPLFPRLNLTIPSFSEPKQHWSVLSKDSSVRTTFLHILRGQHICLPPTARSYPYLATDAIAQKDPRLRSPSHAIQYVGFDAERGTAGAGVMRGAYMSARYESRKEETDFSLRDYLFGNTELNPDETLARHPNTSLVDQVMSDLKLETLETMPVTNLSNGQTRRARIAKALLAQPELLLLDGTFMGLDPPTVRMLVDILHKLAESHSPRLVLSLRPDEEYPAWITHTVYLNTDYTVHSSGSRVDVIRDIHERAKKASTGTSFSAMTKEDQDLLAVSISLRANEPVPEFLESNEEYRLYVRTRSLANKDLKDARNVVSRDGFSPEPTPVPPPGEALIEMKGVNVKYDGRSVLGDWKQQIDGETKEGLWWSVHRGQRWGVFGPNGSGKTTLISLITSDHPQTYSLPITIFGRSRLPQPGQPGISIFDIQSRIGHSSPEVHTFFPKYLTVRRTLESAWAETPLTKPKSTYEIDSKVNAALCWFRAELNPALGPSKVELLDTRRVYQQHQQVGQLGEATRFLDEEDTHGDLTDWADHMKFSDMTFSAQRVALFIRAVIRNPDLVILDEAFSGMDDAAKDKCTLFLSRGENATFRFKQTGHNAKPLARKPSVQESFHSRLGRVKLQGLGDHQALIVISHKREEVPGCVRNWICLSEPGQGPPRTGELLVPLELKLGGWNEIWGTRILPMRVSRDEGLSRYIRSGKNAGGFVNQGERKREVAAQKAKDKEMMLARERIKYRERRVKALKVRLLAEIEIANSMSDGLAKDFQESKVKRLERSIAGNPLTEEERGERRRESGRRHRGAAWLLQQPKMTKAEWEAAGRPGENAEQKEARLRYNEKGKERMRLKRQEERERKSKIGEKTSKLETSAQGS